MDQYITTIALTGKKKSIVKMLNAVISNVGLEEAIVEVDGLETINSKLTDDDGCGIEIGIPDLLSSEHLTDVVLMQKKAEFEKDCEEDEPYNVCSGRAIEFVRVEDSGNDYIAKFSLYEYEEYCYAVSDGGTIHDDNLLDNECVYFSHSNQEEGCIIDAFRVTNKMTIEETRLKLTSFTLSNPSVLNLFYKVLQWVKPKGKNMQELWDMILEAAIAQYKTTKLVKEGYFASFDDAVKSLPEEIVITQHSKCANSIAPYDSYGYTIAEITGVSMQGANGYPDVDVIMYLKRKN